MEIKDEDSISASLNSIKESDKERKEVVSQYSETGFPRRPSIKENFVYKCEKVKWLISELKFELFGGEENNNESDD